MRNKNSDANIEIKKIIGFTCYPFCSVNKKVAKKKKQFITLLLAISQAN